MEGSSYTDATLRIVEELHQEFHGSARCSEAYLFRTPDDLTRLIEKRISVRIVKGAYNEPATSLTSRRPRLRQPISGLWSRRCRREFRWPSPPTTTPS